MKSSAGKNLIHVNDIQKGLSREWKMNDVLLMKTMFILSVIDIDNWCKINF